MADIELIIKIPEENYEKYKRLGDKRNILFEAIRNGVPLPKGHGKLIILSEDAIIREQTSFYFSGLDWISEVGLSNATVATIESDKDNSNDWHFTKRS